ncbi:MAG: tRNA (adenosine(37)-N6)-dimethylallyltransferase MiaA [bacterium]|nr:tRNA (adenosine(37)-N6)-dimethylallyltransferase MiaA [bacterium]
MPIPILCIVGPTASGKSARAIEEALSRDGLPTQAGEIISVDSRQVYRDLDIGTEKMSREEMRNVPHHLIDIRDPHEPYSAGDFVADAARLIHDITARGNLPILVGGTHFYFDALLHGLPENAPPDQELRRELEGLATDELYARVRLADPRRAAELDPHNRRRLVRALEIIATHSSVPLRKSPLSFPVGINSGHAFLPYDIEWVVIDLPREELRTRIDARLASAFDRGLIEEVRRVRESLMHHLSPYSVTDGYESADKRLNELGLEYRVVGEYLRGERSEESLLPALSAKLWQYARRQKAWLRKLTSGFI